MHCLDKKIMNYELWFLTQKDETSNFILTNLKSPHLRISSTDLKIVIRIRNFFGYKSL